MDASAIRAIADLAISAAASNRLDTHTPAIVLGDKVVPLEHLQALRSRFRGRLTTDSLADFVHYAKINNFPDAKPAVFIDSANLRATAFFNLGNYNEPGHADHTAALALENTAAYRALLAADGKKLDQRALADWAEEWAPQIAADDGLGNPIAMPIVVAAIRSITIKTVAELKNSVGNFSAGRTAMEDIEAKADRTGTLPHNLYFTFCPALGLPEQTARLRLSLLTGEEKPVFVLRWLGREQVIEAIGQDFKRVLFGSLEDVATLTIGTFSP